MNKLEELKALLEERDRWKLEWINAVKAEDDEEVIRSYRLSYRIAKQAASLLSEILLPDLIAVAEAAKKIDWPNVCLKNYEERHLVNVLQDALLSLTKDTDK